MTPTIAVSGARFERRVIQVRPLFEDGKLGVRRLMRVIPLESFADVTEQLNLATELFTRSLSFVELGGERGAHSNVLRCKVEGRMRRSADE